MNILFTICGRAGSKGIKNKNISDFCGVKLPYYTMSAIDLYLKSHQKLDYDVVVSTDSPELIDIATMNPFFDVSIIDRSASLSGDTVAKIDVIEDCLVKMGQRKDKKYDLVVDLDITSPLRKAEDIEKLIEKAKESNADVTFSVTEARRNPFFNQVMKADKGYTKVILSDYTARQQAPEILDMNASMYAYKPDYLINNKGVFGGYTEIIKMYDTGILDLDHPNDYEIMQVIAKYLFENDKDFAKIYENAKKEVSNV